ncbi:unnamed protein product [Prorocentrum cordatum]|uniref:Uncharacterized protein n=1 Tax=Prorocentrum cordatum TaxID=2364126 RepID=A0ABN9UW12_9DINO|nr:unnamed protein product [Polarella glacialis]
MTDFFEAQENARRAGTRLSEYITIFDEGVTKLSEDGVELADDADILGWFFVRRLNITRAHRGRLMAALPRETFQLREAQTTAMRIYQDNHINERGHPRQRRPFEQKKPRQGGKGRPPPKAVNVTEYEDDEGLEEDEADDDCIEELAQRELEALATDLGDINEEELDHDQAEAVEKAAAQLTELPEGAVDSACAWSAMGTLWWNDYCAHLKSLGVDKLATFKSAHETFKFGDGSANDSDTQVRSLVAAAKVPHFIQDRSTGHCVLDLNPEAYHVLRSHSRDKNVTDELPRRLRPRTAGGKTASRIMALVRGAQAAASTNGQGLGPAAEAVKEVASVSQTQNLKKVTFHDRPPGGHDCNICANPATFTCSCGIGTCVGCERQGLCPGCKYDVDMVGLAEGNYANLVQNASWRFITRGQQEQNLAGITKAKTLHDHNVSTNKVKQLIQLEQADQAHGQAVAAIRRGRPWSYTLFELAREPNTLLGRELNAAGGMIEPYGHISQSAICAGRKASKAYS